MSPMMASYTNSRTPDASSTMMRTFWLWKPWKRSAVFVEKPYAIRLFESSRVVWLSFPPMSSLLRSQISRISLQRVFLTCLSDGAVVMTRASSCAISHHMTARAAVYVFPDALHDRTATCRFSLRARSICRCFCHGFSFSQSMANFTGSWKGLVDRVCVDSCVVDLGVFTGYHLTAAASSSW